MRLKRLIPLCVSVAVMVPGLHGEDLRWRRSLDQLTARPAASARLQDVQRLDQYARTATLTPGDYEANREAFRRVASYLAVVELLAHDPELRQLSRRANHRIALGLGLPWVDSRALDSREPDYSSQQDYRPQDPVPQPLPAEPAPAPFQRQAPGQRDVAAADQAMAGALQERYEFAAARGATAWQSAETIRRRLKDLGMDLNIQTSTSLARVRLYLETAYDALRDKAWDEATVNIARAEYETGKVFNTVGR